MTPSSPLTVVVVPTIYWQKAKELLTSKELGAVRNGEKALIVTFATEDDARAFTHILRQECNVLLPVTDGSNA